MSSPLEQLQQGCVSPRNVDPDMYMSYQSAFNEAYISRARGIIEEHDIVGSIQEVIALSSGERRPRITLLTTGSDGRSEKALASPIEIVVLTDQLIEKSQGERVRKVIREILQQYNNNLNTKLFDSVIEIKSTRGGKLAHFIGDYEMPMPTRLFDGKYICGDCELLTEAKAQMVHEIIGEKGRSIVESMRDRLREAKRIVPSGKQKIKLQGKDLNIEHYNLQNGLAWYCPDKHITSFKQGPLRLIHYRTATELLKAIRKVGPDIGARWLTDIPLGIVDRWYFLQAEKAVSVPFKKLQEWGHLYNNFLWHYSLSEFDYVRENNSEISFDSQAMIERTKALIAIDEQMTGTP